MRLENVEAPIESDGLARLRVCGKGNKERIVWLTTSLWQTLQAWLQVWPEAETTYLFLNHRNNPIRVNGIQYRLAQHCMVAEVTLSCHRLRHTFARRMVENGMSVDSLAKLLGHSDLKTTQRYIDGADPTVRHDFTEIMKHLETSLVRDRKPPVLPPKPQLRPSPKPRTAPEADLQKLRKKLTVLPNWLAESVDAYLSWHWITWRAQTAYAIGSNLVNGVQRIWTWLAAHRQIDGWSSFNRPDLEAWLKARYQDGVTDVTIRNDLARLRSLLKFLEERDYPIDPGLFRIQPPKQTANPLPRYLSETDYRWLENNILQATKEDTYKACFDRAWFLMLAHTGIRLSELLDLRLDDVNLSKGFATIRGGKPGRDRVVYLTPRLVNALGRYLHLRPDLPEIDYLFVLRGRSPTGRTIQRRLATYSQQAGVEVSPHRLRHTMATRLINRGMPIHSLRKLLGHQHLSTTQLYARIYDETLYRQFQEAMSRQEIDAVEDQGSYLNEPVMAEIGVAD